MALFQPTFVTPDASWGIGNGVIDATQTLNVSWQVNGNSPMVAYEIKFYENNTASTLLHDTGKVTLDTPYYGVLPNGDPNDFFSVSFAPADLATWGIENGGEYKIVITQWWSVNDSVTQTSASAFTTRTRPTLTIQQDYPTPLVGRTCTFTGVYTQAEGDAINWVRWQIAYADDLDNPFYDTQNIYGAVQLQCTYDGFFNNTDYAVRVMAQSASGVEVASQWATVSVSYETNEMTGYIKVSRACDASAVHVYWPDLFTVTGEADGEYSIEDDNLVLPEGTTVTWSKRDGEAYEFETPWGVAFAGTLVTQDCTLFDLKFSDNTHMTLQFVASSRSLLLKNGSTTVNTVTGINAYAHLNIVLSETKLYVRQDYLGGGLYPNATLYPSDTLYPRADTVPMNTVNNYNSSYTQKNIVEVSMSGDMLCDFLLISRGSIPESIIEGMTTQKNYPPTAGAQNYFYAKFEESLDAGSLSIGNDDVVGYEVYRRQESESRLQYIGEIPVGASGFYDYGARSQQGPYLYYVFPMGETTYVTEPIISDGINPCFWDWTLLECSQGEKKNTYTVDRAFNFGKNLVSGSISNNAMPGQFDNFTRYPLIQKPTSHYQSGVLSSLIGKIAYDAEHSGYYETLSMRDAIFELSHSTKPKFLKSRKGDLMMVEINDAIVTETADETREQAITIQLPWAEVGDASDVTIISMDVV